MQEDLYLILYTLSWTWQETNALHQRNNSGLSNTVGVELMTEDS